MVFASSGCLRACPPCAPHPPMHQRTAAHALPLFPVWGIARTALPAAGATILQVSGRRPGRKRERGCNLGKLGHNEPKGMRAVWARALLCPLPYAKTGSALRARRRGDLQVRGEAIREGVVVALWRLTVDLWGLAAASHTRNHRPAIRAPKATREAAASRPKAQTQPRQLPPTTPREQYVAAPLCKPHACLMKDGRQRSDGRRAPGGMQVLWQSPSKPTSPWIPEQSATSARTLNRMHCETHPRDLATSVELLRFLPRLAQNPT